MDDSAGAGDGQQPARQAPVVDVAGEVAVDPLETLGPEPCFLGIDLDLQLGHLSPSAR